MLQRRLQQGGASAEELNLLSNRTLESLLEGSDLGGLSKEQVMRSYTCIFMTCLNFMRSDREAACNQCAEGLVHGIRTSSVGVNSVALGYATDMLSLLNKPYQESWCNNKMATCDRKDNFPGPNTTSIMGWDSVAKMMSEYPEKEWSGEWWRGNELGFIINNPFFWSGNKIDPLSITLGILPSQHAAIRPVMEEMFTVVAGTDKHTEVQGVVDQMIQGFLANGKKNGIKVPDDLKALVHQILNKVALRRDVSFKYAQEFVELMDEVVTLGTISHLVPEILYRFLMPIKDKIAKYAGEYAAIIRDLWGSQLKSADCSPSTSCVEQAASMVFDAFYSAGGLSVPSTISTGIGLLFSDHASSPFPGASFTPAQAESFYWENIRYFPPVVGFPHWERRPTCAGSTAKATAGLQRPEGATKACPLGKVNSNTGYPKVNQFGGGVRVVPSLALAQRDPRKWGVDAGEFKVRPLTEYRKSLGFAERAVNSGVAGGKMDRVCPGKTLAIMIGTSFFTQFKKSEWAKPYGAIEFLTGPTFVSAFTLSSKSMVANCKEICPNCGLTSLLSSCPAQLAKCQADKYHCSMCKNCKSNPPSWWDWIRRVACKSC